MANKEGLPKVIVQPLLLFFALLGLAFLLEQTLGLDYPKAPVLFRLPTAFILAIYAGYLAIHAVWVFKKAGNSTDPRKPPRAIVQEGPFKFSRNPMYLSLLICFFALTVWFYSMWLFFLNTLFWMILDLTAVGPEEKYLEEKFGEAYVTYKLKVSRWI